MPAQDRFGSRDRSQLFEYLVSQDLAFDGQAPALVVIQEDPFLPELLSENSILRYEVLDSVMLAAIDPACEDQEQKLPRLKLRFHVPPDARQKSAASRIIRPLSSVGNAETGIHFKSCRHSHL
jgi:hypothetical protein